MKNFRVALCVPESALVLSDACPPLNLGYIASYLRKTVPNVEVKIFDGVVKQNVEEQIFMFQPNIVGVTAVTPQAPAAYRLLDTLHRNRPDIFTVIGGVHATQLPNEAKAHADCVVVGEGEKAFSGIVKARINGEVVAAIVQGEPVENLDDLPSPAFDLLDMDFYLKVGAKFPKLPSPNIAMVTSRNCPYRCRFCYNSSRTSKAKYFSAQRIVDELLFLRETYGINAVLFSDDEFLINTKRLMELAVLFKNHGVDKWLKWGCLARARTISVPILELAKSMNCILISVGFESGCDRILSYLKNNSASVKDNAKALLMAKQVGVTMGGSFIIGTPTESFKEIQETYDWCANNEALVFYGVNVLTPYPGTEIWKYCVTHGLLPEPLDYEKLIPPQYPSDSMVSSLPHKQFRRAVVDFHRTAWLTSKVRLDPSFKTFFKSAKTFTWWYLWVTHPRTVFKLMCYSVRKGVDKA